MIDLDSDCTGLPLRDFAADEVILEEGGRSGALYFLKCGRVEVSRAGQVLATVDKPGTVLGEVSILLDRPHMAEVKALVPTSFHIAADAERYLAEHPGVTVYLARELAKKVDTMACYLSDLKAQYADDDSHLGMVHEVLDSLLQLKQ